MATVNGSSTIHGSGTATAGAIGLASTTTTIAEYTGEDGGEYVPALDLNPRHANAAYSFADPDLLAAVLEADVVGRFVDDAEQPTVQEILWQSDDPDAPALLVALKDREQARPECLRWVGLQNLGSDRNAHVVVRVARVIVMLVPVLAIRICSAKCPEQCQYRHRPLSHVVVASPS
jgi:hypothetical protein